MHFHGPVPAAVNAVERVKCCMALRFWSAGADRYGKAQENGLTIIEWIYQRQRLRSLFLFCVKGPEVAGLRSY